LIVAVTQGSLTDGTSLVLVNASNTNGKLGSGVSGAIRRACGPGFQAEIERSIDARFGGPMPPGEVVVTSAGAHPRARHIAHVAVMDYREGFTAASFPDAALIQRCCENLWPAIEAIGEPSLSVAMVALGAGTGNLGVRLPTEIACTTLAAHLKDGPSRIEAVTFYGYELHEYIAILDVVSGRFPIDWSEVPDEIRKRFTSRA
jgi:O-acetyl-ADP-ribose deacetylase (regulator of RNase III)